MRAEQYPKALGSTVSEVKDVLPEDSIVVDKTKFSMCGVWCYLSLCMPLPLFLDSRSFLLPKDCSPAFICSLFKSRHGQLRSGGH